MSNLPHAEKRQEEQSVLSHEKKDMRNPKSELPKQPLGFLATSAIIPSDLSKQLLLPEAKRGAMTSHDAPDSLSSESNSTKKKRSHFQITNVEKVATPTEQEGEESGDDGDDSRRSSTLSTDQLAAAGDETVASLPPTSAPEQRTYKIIKVSAKDPYSRGRWKCREFTTPPAAEGQGKKAADAAAGSRTSSARGSGGNGNANTSVEPNGSGRANDDSTSAAPEGRLKSATDGGSKAAVSAAGVSPASDVQQPPNTPASGAHKQLVPAGSAPQRIGEPSMVQKADGSLSHGAASSTGGSAPTRASQQATPFEFYLGEDSPRRQPSGFSPLAQRIPASQAESIFGQSLARGAIPPYSSLFDFGASANASSGSGQADGPGDDTSGTNVVAIDNKIEQAMDLVKSHLMYAVREEVEVLKEKIEGLEKKIYRLEWENSILRETASPETLARLAAGFSGQPTPVSAPPAVTAGPGTGGAATPVNQGPSPSAQQPSGGGQGSAAGAPPGPTNQLVVGTTVAPSAGVVAPTPSPTGGQQAYKQQPSAPGGQQQHQPTTAGQPQTSKEQK